MRKFIKIETGIESNINFKNFFVGAKQYIGKLIVSASLGLWIFPGTNPNDIKNQKPDAQTVAPSSSPAPKRTVPKPKKKPKNCKCRASK
jgi:hypothetical protein